MVAVVSNLVGIVTSAVVMGEGTNSYYGLCSVVYAGVGLLDMVTMVAW